MIRILYLFTSFKIEIVSLEIQDAGLSTLERTMIFK